MGDQEFLFDYEELPQNEPPPAPPAKGPEMKTEKKPAEPASPPPGEEPVKMKFEEALDRLEKVVAEMESGELSLEDCIKRFEEGSKLAKFCTAKLKETERRVEILLQKESGEEEWTNFEEQ